MLVELHCHTHYSRGKKILYDAVDSPQDMVRQAKRLGLGAIAITDHNTIQGALKAQQYARIPVIIGEEISSCDGHILAVGIQETIPQNLTVPETIDCIRNQGGVAIAAHPFDIHNDGVGELCTMCDAVEVFNAQSLERRSNRKSLSFARQHGLPMVAGSDAHSAAMLGYGVNEVAGATADDVLVAIKRGAAKPHMRYVPLWVMQDLVVRKLKLSYTHTVNYMENHHSRILAALVRQSIKMVKKSPGRIDALFRLMTYLFLGGTIVYGGIRDLV